jgi:hypothetical protein
MNFEHWSAVPGVPIVPGQNSNGRVAFPSRRLVKNLTVMQQRPDGARVSER